MAYYHLTLIERAVIFTEHNIGTSCRSIGRLLSRHHTTISREIKRNGSIYARGYLPDRAQDTADLRRLLTRPAPKRSNKKLYRFVIERLKAEDSPDIIAGGLPRDFPNDPEMRVSHETIYRWIYDDYLNGGTLYKLLYSGNRKRQPRAKYGYKKGIPEDRASIHDRPKSADSRRTTHHWEGDLVEGARGTGFFATQVERKSRLIVANKVPSKHAVPVATTMIRQLSNYYHNIKTLTLDNGKEFYEYKKVEKALNIKVYFADPYSSYQRRTNEHANGMLRRYFPKGTDFSTVTNRQLQSAVDKINNRRRKILQYRTPMEVFYGF